MNRVIMLVLLTAYLMVGVGVIDGLTEPVVWAAEGDESGVLSDYRLPSTNYFKPGTDVSFGSGLSRVGIRLINWVAGIAGTLVLAYAFFRLIVDVWQAIARGGEIRQLGSRLLLIVVGSLIVLMSLTGSWYPVIKTIYEGIIGGVIGSLGDGM